VRSQDVSANGSGGDATAVVGGSPFHKTSGADAASLEGQKQLQLGAAAAIATVGVTAAAADVASAPPLALSVLGEQLRHCRGRGLVDQTAQRQRHGRGGDGWVQVARDGFA
jgi:hypothetical protein